MIIKITGWLIVFIINIQFLQVNGDCKTLVECVSSFFSNFTDVLNSDIENDIKNITHVNNVNESVVNIVDIKIENNDKFEKVFNDLNNLINNNSVVTNQNNSAKTDIIAIDLLNLAKKNASNARTDIIKSTNVMVTPQNELQNKIKDKISPTPANVTKLNSKMKANSVKNNTSIVKHMSKLFLANKDEKKINNSTDNDFKPVAKESPNIVRNVANNSTNVNLKNIFHNFEFSWQNFTNFDIPNVDNGKDIEKIDTGNNTHGEKTNEFNNIYSNNNHEIVNFSQIQLPNIFKLGYVFPNPFIPKIPPQIDNGKKFDVPQNEAKESYLENSNPVNDFINLFNHSTFEKGDIIQNFTFTWDNITEFNDAEIVISKTPILLKSGVNNDNEINVVPFINKSNPVTMSIENKNNNFDYLLDYYTDENDNTTDYPIIDYVEFYKDTTNEIIDYLVTTPKPILKVDEKIDKIQLEEKDFAFNLNKVPDIDNFVAESKQIIHNKTSQLLVSLYLFKKLLKLLFNFLLLNILFERRHNIFC